MNELFALRPNVLADVVRNVVIARAVAGAYDPSETEKQAVTACRAAARHSLKCERLNSPQAAEVDTLVRQVRQQTNSTGSPFLGRGTADVSVAALAAARPHTTTLAAPQREDETMKMLLAAILRVEQLIVAVLAVVMRHALSSTSIRPYATSSLPTKRPDSPIIFDADFDVVGQPHQQAPRDTRAASPTRAWAGDDAYAITTYKTY